jgi:hypothetical protein
MGDSTLKMQKVQRVEGQGASVIFRPYEPANHDMRHYRPNRGGCCRQYWNKSQEEIMLQCRMLAGRVYAQGYIRDKM